MVLKKVTKSIPLTGGVGNDVPDELLSPPGMLRMENLRYTKKDFAEKIEPVETTGNSTLAGVGAQRPEVCVNVKDAVVTIGATNVGRYDESGWRLTPHQGAINGLDRVLTSSTQAGGAAFTWCRLGIWTGSAATALSFERRGYAVAFEKRDVEASSVQTYVYLQRYDNGGNLIDETQIGTGGVFAPQVWGAGDSDGGVLCVQTTARTVNFYTIEPISDSTAATFVSSQGGGNIGEERQEFGASSYTCGTMKREEMRLGFAFQHQGTVPNYVASYHPEWDVGGYAYKNVSTGLINWQLLGADGLPTGSTYALATSADSAPFYRCLYSIDVNTNYVGIFHTLCDTTSTANDTDVFMARVSHTNTGYLTETISTYPTPYGNVTHASVAWSSYTSSTLNYGYHWNEMGFNTRMGDGDAGKAKCYFGKTAWSGIVADYELRGHALASNLVMLDGSNDFACVVQQWANFTPNEGGVNHLASATTPAAIKGVTSALIKIDISENTAHLIATMDPGQSKQCDATIFEQQLHLGNLYCYADEGNDTSAPYNTPLSYTDTFAYGNRNILGVEDCFVYLTTDTPKADNDAEGTSALVAADAKLNVYEIGPHIGMNAVSHGEGFMVNSAVPLWYDGGTLNEMSIVDQPEIVEVTASATGGAAIQSIAYNEVAANFQVLTAIIGYTDQSGKVHRSAPSFPVFVENIHAQGATSVTELQVVVTTPLSFGGSNRSYFCEVYMAAAGDSVPDLAGVQFFEPMVSDLEISMNVPCTLSPTTVATAYEIPHQSKALYTAGNVLPADPWPNMIHTVVTSRRLFGIGAADPGLIFYSKVFDDGVAPEFSAPLVMSLGGGVQLTALGRVDDKVIVFEKGAMHVIYGSGPDNTGANGDFFVEKLSSTLGCEDIESIQVTPDGLSFFSSVTQEFHLISRDLQIHDIGGPVLSLTGDPDFDILASVLYAKADEIRWYCENVGTTDLVAEATIPSGGKEQPPRARVGRSVLSSGTYKVLIYNYEYGKWSVGTLDTAAYSAGLYQDRPCYMDSSFDLRVTGTDWTVAQKSLWETPWIKVNQLQDYGRFWGATFLGHYLSSWVDTGGVVEAGDLQITASFDYEEDGTTETFRFRANQDLGASNGERLQFQIQPARQKCQAVKFKIQEIATTAIEVSEPAYTTGRGVALLSVDLHYGAKGGSARVPAGRKK